MLNALEADFKFFAQANAVAGEETSMPGIIEGLNDLERRGIGQPIYTKFDASPKPYKEDILVGIILPLDEDYSRHLVELITGERLLIEPRSPEDMDTYRKFLGPDAQSFFFTDVKSMSDISLGGFDNRFLGSRVAVREEEIGSQADIEVLEWEAYKIALKLNQGKAVQLWPPK